MRWSSGRASPPRPLPTRPRVVDPLKIPARVSFVTLACRDVAAMKRFYDQFGWSPSQHNDDSFAAYQCGGAGLGLFGAENYVKAYGEAPTQGRFRGVVLNCRDAAEVDRIYDELRRPDGVTMPARPPTSPSADADSSGAIPRGTCGK